MIHLSVVSRVSIQQNLHKCIKYMHVNIIMKENEAINMSTEKMERISGRLAVRD